MSKVTITVTDLEDDQINFKVELDPPIKDLDFDSSSNAQQLAVAMIAFAKKYMQDGE